MHSGMNYRRTALLLAVYAMIGLAVGLVAIVFQQLMSVVNVLVLEGIAGYGETRIVWGERRLSLPWTRPPAVRWWLLPGLAGLGGLLTGLIVYRFAPEAAGHGTDEVIHAYHHKGGRLRFRSSLVMMIASALTIGTGGSGGKEGPITQIGAGFASLIAQSIPFLRAYRREILLAGMAAGIAAIFRAPLAAAIFATEILYSDLRFYGLHRVFQSLRIPLFLKPAIGGVLTGLVAILIPQVLGEGSFAMQKMLNGSLPLGLLAACIVSKIMATSFSIGSGGSGGIFGPSLFIGAALGGTFGGIYPWMFPGSGIPLTVFAKRK